MDLILRVGVFTGIALANVSGSSSAQVDTASLGSMRRVFEDQFAKLYDSGNGSGLAALWIPTGSFSSAIPGKPTFTGRLAISTMWAATFTANRPWPRVTIAVRNARLIASERAEVEGVMTYSIDSTAARPTSDFRAALVKERGDWKIVSMTVGLLRGLRID